MTSRQPHMSPASMTIGAKGYYDLYLEKLYAKNDEVAGGQTSNANLHAQFPAEMVNHVAATPTSISYEGPNVLRDGSKLAMDKQLNLDGSKLGMDKKLYLDDTLMRMPRQGARFGPSKQDSKGSGDATGDRDFDDPDESPRAIRDRIEIDEIMARRALQMRLIAPNVHGKRYDDLMRKTRQRAERSQAIKAELTAKHEAAMAELDRGIMQADHDFEEAQNELAKLRRDLALGIVLGRHLI